MACTYYSLCLSSVLDLFLKEKNVEGATFNSRFFFEIVKDFLGAQEVPEVPRRS